VSATLTRDYEIWEIGAAVAIAIAVQLGAGAMFYVASSGVSFAPEVDKGAQTPVKVTPVLDEELLPPKLGGGKKSVLPDMWQRAPASVKQKIAEAPPPPEVAAPSPEAKDDPTVIPDAGHKVATVEDASVEEKDAGEEGADAGLTTSEEDAGLATLDPDGGAGPGGEGDPNGVPDGGLDKFQERQYVGRLIGFFKRGFVVSGLGLPPEDIAKLAVSVTVQLDGLTVKSYSLGSSGNPTFDAAARAAMDAKVGSQVPPPPEDRPDLQRSSLSFSMVCSAACN
jgi:hypothetical protein